MHLIASWSLCGFGYLAVGLSNLPSCLSSSKSHPHLLGKQANQLPLPVGFVFHNPLVVLLFCFIFFLSSFTSPAVKQPRALKMQNQSATANTQMRGLVGPHTDVDI